MKDKYNVIGLMSGTSLDGLDIAFCSFEHKNGQWSFDLQASKSVDYGKDLYDRLKGAVSLSGLELLLLNIEYGQWLGTQVKSFIDEHGIQTDFVSSHGHTIFHQPEKGLTYQLGDGQEIANQCGLKVICNFRVKDVKLGGQGAPLVPIGDKYLFSAYDFCLNLGGISNISFTHQAERVAFDIGIANMALNHLAGQLGFPYDKDGAIARSGKLDQSLFNQLNEIPYYNQPFPKSTGFEWFQNEVLPILENNKTLTQDKICTVTHHIAYTVAREVNRLGSENNRLLVTGGGAKNGFLMEMLKNYLKGSTEIVLPENSIVEFKEAIVFALMGILRDRDEVNCLSSVTGATSDSSAGEVYFPGSYS